MTPIVLGLLLAICHMSHDPKNDQTLWASESCPLGKGESLNKTKVAKVIEGDKLYEVVKKVEDVGTISFIVQIQMKCYKYWPQPDVTVYELAILLPYAQIGNSYGNQPMWPRGNVCFNGQSLIDQFESEMGVALRHWKAL